MDDFRRQVVGQQISLELLGHCAERYGVSLTAAILKWLEFTDVMRSRRWSSVATVLCCGRDPVMRPCSPRPSLYTQRCATRAPLTIHSLKSSSRGNACSCRTRHRSSGGLPRMVFSIAYNSRMRRSTSCACGEPVSLCRSKYLRLACAQHAASLMSVAGFHAHNAGRTVGEVFQELGALELHVADLARLGFDPIGLEDVLGQINTDHVQSSSIHDGISGLPVRIILHPWALRCCRPGGSASLSIPAAATKAPSWLRGGRRPFHSNLHRRGPRLQEQFPHLSGCSDFRGQLYVRQLRETNTFTLCSCRPGPL
jgi:hypothetical protein